MIFSEERIGMHFRFVIPTGQSEWRDLSAALSVNRSLDYALRDCTRLQRDNTAFSTRVDRSIALPVPLAITEAQHRLLRSV